MVVKVDVKHVYKHPLDQVMRAHLNKVFFVYCTGAHMDWYKVFGQLGDKPIRRHIFFMTEWQEIWASSLVADSISTGRKLQPTGETG